MCMNRNRDGVGKRARTKAGNMTLFRETIKLHVIVFIVARRCHQAARANREGSAGTGLHGSVLMAIGFPCVVWRRYKIY